MAAPLDLMYLAWGFGIAVALGILCVVLAASDMCRRARHTAEISISAVMILVGLASVWSLSGPAAAGPLNLYLAWLLGVATPYGAIGAILVALIVDGWRYSTLIILAVITIASILLVWVLAGIDMPDISIVVSWPDPSAPAPSTEVPPPA